MPTTRLLKDRVKDTTTTTGTGSLTLSGTAPTGYESFNTAFGTNTYFYYCISSTGAEWEVGIGYLSTSTTLVRDSIVASSNSDAVVSLSAGTKDVFCTIAGPWVQELWTPGRGYASARGYAMP